MNEKGVSVSATVSTSNNDNVKAADPLVDTGICEISLTSVILMSAESARDGVEKLADLIDTYGSTGFGNGQYFRYWQGVNYLNEELSETVSVERDGEAAPEGPFNMLFEADHQLTTYEVLRLLACRGEGTQYAADNNPENNPNGTAIGNERQAECHVFEIRSDMPEELATILMRFLESVA